MTCTRDGREHAIKDSEVAAGAAKGRYRAMCGALVLPQALVAPSGPPCQRCTALLLSPNPCPPLLSTAARLEEVDCRCDGWGSR
jgi:hypothetical protein